MDPVPAGRCVAETVCVGENEGPAEIILWEKTMPSNVALCKMDGMSWSGFSAEV